MGSVITVTEKAETKRMDQPKADMEAGKKGTEGEVRRVKSGLVLEGGGMRGIYTAGVLDVFMEQGVSFDGVIGVSAGALHEGSHGQYAAARQWHGQGCGLCLSRQN